MKVIIIYSGKGGVGKTTTTANLAKVLAEEGKKVFILDADVNTPSMPVVFPKPSQKNIKIASLGYTSKKSIYLTNSAIRLYISECIQSINEYKPDYVLVDTPPSVTEVHINLLEKIKPSGLLIVTQPNALSIEDVNRTVLFFQQRSVNIIGIVENMCVKEVKNEYPWKLLGSIPFEQDFDFKSVYDKSKERYKEIVPLLENVEAVILENKKRQLFDETIEEDDVLAMEFSKKKDLRFINVKTWGLIKDIIADHDRGMIKHDEFLDWMTNERISRMLKVFETDEQGYFMVTKAPCCVIQLLPGEIGLGTLHITESHYGVPRIKYNTMQGEIILFPHEIMPVDNAEILRNIEDGHMITKDGRYIPSKDILQQVENAFGSRVGLPKNWEKIHDDIMNGNLPQINENPVNEPTEEIKKRKPKGRNTQTIRDIQWLGEKRKRG